MITIGIDPDSKAHGVAVYEGGKLITLKCMDLFSFLMLVDVGGAKAKTITVHIEDVCANNAIFMPPSKNPNKVAEAKARGRTLGMCQQSQREIERICEHLNIKIVKHKISKVWKKDKAQFEKVTGWTGRSNEDTRSAAYFGWLGLN